jgi:hypothetical protein
MRFQLLRRGDCRRPPTSCSCSVGAAVLLTASRLYQTIPLVVCTLPRMSDLGKAAQLLHDGSSTNSHLLISQQIPPPNFRGWKSRSAAMDEEQILGPATRNDDITAPVSVHCRKQCRLSGSRCSRLGGVVAFFSHPALVALTVAFFMPVGVAFFAGKRKPRRTRGSKQPLGPRCLCGGRTARRLFCQP